MSAALALQAAHDAGLHVEIDGADLVLDAPAPPPPEVIALLAQHKAELIALLRGDDPAASCPREWAAGFTQLAAKPHPAGFSAERWRRIIDAAGRFLDEWGEAAAACGWNTLDIFGADAVAPDRRFDCMGLALLLDRCRVIAVDNAGADIVTVTGAQQRFRRRPMPRGTAPLWTMPR